MKLSNLKYTDGFSVDDFDTIDLLTNVRPFTKKERKYLRKAYRVAAKNYEVSGRL